MSQLAAIIHKRMVASGRDSHLDWCVPIAHLIERYSLTVDLDCFSVPPGFVLWDAKRRMVAVYQVTSTSGRLLSRQASFTDVLVLASGQTILGWVLRDQVTESDGAFSVYAEQIRQMPETFDFARTCPHLSDFGGFYQQDKEAWECFGCGELLPAVLG